MNEQSWDTRNQDSRRSIFSKARIRLKRKQMRKINISNCQAGMTLGKAVYYDGSSMLIDAGTILTPSHLEELASLGITELYIQDSLSNDIVVKDVIKDITRLEAIRFMKQTMEKYSLEGMPSSLSINSIVDRILNDILDSEEIIVNLMDIKTYDGYTFSHCVNVCILSLIIGIKLKLGQTELQELGVGALLHDIGKVLIPPEILNKKASLSNGEFEVIKRHSSLGYDILKNIPGISRKSALVALNHHERCDGKGYPMALHGEEIHLYSKIVAVTDIFDALTSDRIYRRKIDTYKAINYLESINNLLLDSQILSCFLKFIPPYPIGTEVTMNSGEKGFVIQLNKSHTPVVRLVLNSDGTPKNRYTEVDLENSKGYFIMSPD